jgi:plastocyanin
VAVGGLIAILALVVTACGGGATPAPTYPPGSIVVTAKDRKFDLDTIRLKADSEVALVFINRDGDMHNLAIRSRSGFDGDLIFRFDPVGTSTEVLTVGPIPAGTYYFLCEVHPSMRGTVVVQ